MTAIEIPEGYMADPRGALVPIETIKPEAIEEDGLVHTLIDEAERLSGDLATFKQRSLDDVQALRELIAEKYKTTIGGKKGNLTLKSFDGTRIVRVQVSDSVAFGPELEVAKKLIDNCIGRWAEGANAQLRALVDDAFQVNKVGRIDTARVLRLRKMDMGGDEEWGRAMEAISDALRVDVSRVYIRFYSVDPVSGRETAIPMGLSDV
ncbi:MAG: DUF3164 family protein [Pseudomonadota bacterium]